MRFTYLLIGLFTYLITATSIHAQTIINIESKRIINDTTGWAGSAKLGAEINENTTTQININTQAHLQYKNGKELYLIVLAGQLLKAGDQDFVNDGLIHMRYNRKINNWLRWEVFAQGQFNKILNINARALTGIGPRIKISSSKKLNLYAAVLYMYEYEKVKNPEVFENNHRLSNYISFNWEPSSTVEITSTTYFQPLLKNWNDNRASSQLKATFKISKNLSFSTAFNLMHDNKPAKGIPRTVYSLINGLKFSF